jgi:hypothetical protein
MLNEYPKEFVDSVMKPLARNCPSSDIVYQATVIIPYVKGIPRNSDASGSISISESSSRLNIHTMRH